jgi:hypothetical protein
MTRWVVMLTLLSMFVLAGQSAGAAEEAGAEDLPGADLDLLEEAGEPVPTAATPLSPTPPGLSSIPASPVLATSGSPPSSSPTVARQCPSPGGPALYPAQVLCPGEVAPARGFLVAPQRYREIRALLLGTLPACEWERDRCRVRLEECHQSGTLTSPLSGASPWPARLAWAAGGLAVGVAAGVALALWGASL